MSLLPVGVEVVVIVVQTVHYRLVLQLAELGQGVVREHILTQPGFDGGSSHGGVDHSYRHSGALLEITGGEVAYGSPFEAGLLAVEHFPFAFGEILAGTVECEGHGNFQVADLVVGVALDFVGHHV